MGIEDRMSLLASKSPREPWAELMLEGAQEIADLRRKSMLTGEEREAVERAADWLDRWQQTHGYHSSESGDIATLRGLLERLK